MRLARPVLVFALVTMLAPLAASAQVAGPPQPRANDRAAIDQMLTARVDEDRADRDAIHGLLQRPEVRDVASRYGLSIERTDEAVNALVGDQLHQLASQARQADEALSGGASTIVISTTTVIIILLVVILLIVALK
jgi:hypothetical protein